MEEKSTEELIKIWNDYDREEWSDEAFEAIHMVLVARGENPLPHTQAKAMEKSKPAAKRTYRGLIWSPVLLVLGVVLLTVGGGYLAAIGLGLIIGAIVGLIVGLISLAGKSK